MVEREVRLAVLEKIDAMRDEIISLTSKLVRIQSINATYPGVETEKVLGGEKENNLVLKSVAEGFGCKAELVEKERERANLAAVLKGVDGGKSLILNGHIDTVPFGDPKEWRWGDPISGKVVDGKMFGRGSTDMKGGIAGMTKAMEAITQAGYRLKGDVIIESVVGEENMSHDIGTDAVISAGYRADAAIVTEPTAPPDRLAVIPVTPGLAWLTISIEGKATHACVRDELIRAGGSGDATGVNALEKGIKIVQALQDLEQEWGITKYHPLFKPGHFTIHPGIFHGAPRGVAIPFVISDTCSIDYAIWYHPRQSYESMKREIEGRVKALSKTDTWLRKHPPEFDWKLNWPSAEISKNHPIVKTMTSAHKTVSGRPAKINGFPAVCDAAFLDIAKIPAVIYGPGDIMAAHAVDEYVETSELITAAKGVALAALDWCGYEKA